MSTQTRVIIYNFQRPGNSCRWQCIQEESCNLVRARTHKICSINVGHAGPDIYKKGKSPMAALRSKEAFIDMKIVLQYFNVISSVDNHSPGVPSILTPQCQFFNSIALHRATTQSVWKLTEDLHLKLLQLLKRFSLTCFSTSCRYCAHSFPLSQWVHLFNRPLPLIISRKATYCIQGRRAESLLL